MREALCEALPFLQQLPAHLLEALDTSTLHLPAGDVQRVRRKLERQLRVHVMSYRRQPSTRESIGVHLCRLLIPATLSASDLALIAQAEVRCQSADVIFVAYRRPLQLRGDGVGEGR